MHAITSLSIQGHEKIDSAVSRLIDVHDDLRMSQMTFSEACFSNHRERDASIASRTAEIFIPRFVGIWRAAGKVRLVHHIGAWP